MDKPITKTGIVYCRVSSKEQVENTSLKSQERLCREYAERNGIQVTGVFVDEGESAKTADRKEFLKAVAFCASKKNKIDYFIVYKLDRFSRNQDDHVVIRARLRQAGTELRSATEPINETPVGRAMEGMISVFAEFDNNIRTERTRSGMLERVKQGIWVWQATLGYYRTSPKTNIVPDPKFTSYIRLAFEEWAKGSYTYRSLAEYLTKRGFRTRYGKIAHASLIEKILKNPIYCGIIQVKGERYRGAFEPIISEDLFNQCQEGYRKRGKLVNIISNNPEFPLRKLVVCPFCTRMFTASFSTGRHGNKYPYYHHQHQNCPSAQFIPRESFEQNFVEYLNEITPSTRYEKIFKAIVIDIWKNNYQKFDDENAKIKRDIEKLEGERQRVFESHQSGAYTEEEFVEQKNLINQRIYAKRCLLQDQHVEELNMEEALDYCFQFVRNTAKTWVRLKAKHDLRLRFQKMIFEENISFDGKKFGTAKLSPVYRLNQESGGKKSNLVALRGIEPLFTP